MSSLIFYSDPEQAYVATDTLGVELSGDPKMFSSKAVYLPHLRTIIAGTGMGMFSGDWAMYVNHCMVVAGILNLDYHTPTSLRSRWQQYQSEHSLPASLTTTVYHFGFSEDDESVRVFAYRSTNSFASEPLAYGFGLKPVCTPPGDESLVDALPAMMREQRDNERAKPPSERLYIGGECIGMHLTKTACTISRVFQFDDYPEHLRAIFENHRANAG